MNKPEQFHLLDGVAEAISLLNSAGLLVFVVTNQGGVGLGYMKEKELRRIHEKMLAELAEHSATIDDIAYCPHKPHEGCRCRKPEAQMLVDLAHKHHVDLSESLMVGDRDIDIEAGKKAGCKTVLLSRSDEAETDADATFSHLLAAVPWMLSELK